MRSGTVYRSFPSRTIYASQELKTFGQVTATAQHFHIRLATYEPVDAIDRIPLYQPLPLDAFHWKQSYS
jgi:hypothetical protein